MLQTLSIVANDIGDEAIKNIADLLKNSTVLTILLFSIRNHFSFISIDTY